MLFPWARAVIASERYGLTLISPTWTQLKVGPLLRGERDLRTYAGLFTSVPGEVCGARRLAILATARRVPEASLADADRLPERCVVEFEGMGGMFSPLRDHEVLLAEWLWRIVRPDVCRTVPRTLERAAAIHVRYGDFSAPDARALQPAGHGNVRAPMEWYISALRELRRAVGSLPAHVFSDATPDQLEPLLAEPDCHLVTYGASVADMLGMSAHAALVGSNSTFSMWASFLNQVPTIWPPRASLHPLHASSDTETELSCDGRLHPSFVAEVARVLETGRPRVGRVAVGGEEP
jgi:hypothetical protein